VLAVLAVLATVLGEMAVAVAVRLAILEMEAVAVTMATTDHQAHKVAPVVAAAVDRANLILVAVLE
jgi:Na+-transporting methylmalonyl-CoA/oxaloacetate decarboxylase gamma subunit